MSVLIDRQVDILNKLCSRDDASTLGLVQKAIDGTLNVHEIEKLCDLISGELLMEGIGPDFEPNKYGKELEALLDCINRKRLES